MRSRTMFEQPPEGLREVVAQIGPAAVGTAASMLFTEGKLMKRLTQGLVGVPFSMYLAPSVGKLLDARGWALEPEAVGVLTAVFGIAIVSYVFELWRYMQIGPLLQEWLAKKLGVHRGADKP